MSKFSFPTGLGLSVLIATPILLAIFLFCDGACLATEPAPNPAVAEALIQARNMQKIGELVEALALFEQLADHGDPSAMYHAGRSFSRGWGVTPDLTKAEYYFTLAIRFDFKERGAAAYELGRVYQRSIGPDCDTLAVKWFEDALKWKFVKASMQLAIHYEKGLGVDRNIPKAIQNFEIATHAGYEQALLKYALILTEGSYDIAPNLKRAELMTAQAISTLERKARTGSASAAKQLGRIYNKGLLVPTDLQLARKWLLQSARSGSTGGMHDYARLVLADTENPDQYQDAIDWLRAAAERGHGGSMTTLGRLHLTQKHNLSKTEAVAWFEMGVQAGHGGSMEELALLYQQGPLVEINLSEAIRLARMGTNQGHRGCTRLLAQLTQQTSDSQ